MKTGQSNNGCHTGEAENSVLLSPEAWVSQQSQYGPEGLEDSWRAAALSLPCNAEEVGWNTGEGMPQ